MNRLGATLAALAVTLVVTTAEGAVAERLPVREPAWRSVGVTGSELPVHTQEPVQGARCREKKCTPEPIDAEATAVGAMAMVE
jgi:hypothetical protein